MKRPVPPGLENEMSTGRGSFGRIFMTSSYVSYLGDNGREASTRWSRLTQGMKATCSCQPYCAMLPPLLPFKTRVFRRTNSSIRQNMKYLPHPSAQPSPAFVDACDRVANLNPEGVSCAACVNLANHTLSFPWASIFSKKRKPKPPLSERHLLRQKQTREKTCGTSQSTRGGRPWHLDHALCVGMVGWARLQGAKRLPGERMANSSQRAGPARIVLRCEVKRLRI